MAMTEYDLSSSGALLRAFRKRRHLTQQQLANAVGVHRSAIIRWEQGDFLPESKTMVLELARHLRLDNRETRHVLKASLAALAARWHIALPNRGEGSAPPFHLNCRQWLLIKTDHLVSSFPSSARDKAAFCALYL